MCILVDTTVDIERCINLIDLQTKTYLNLNLDAVTIFEVEVEDNPTKFEKYLHISYYLNSNPSYIVQKKVQYLEDDILHTVMENIQQEYSRNKK